MSLPEYLEAGEKARLIPVVANGQRERAACSVLLAALRIVRPYWKIVCEDMGHKVGPRASISSFTEPRFKNQRVTTHAGRMVCLC